MEGATAPFTSPLAERLFDRLWQYHPYCHFDLPEVPPMRRNIAKDTILLTIIQMSLDGLALLLNIFMTNALGSEAIGIFSLTGSFFSLAALTAGGNVFLCSSRFISEELGKQNGSPVGILKLCMVVSVLLSLLFSLGIMYFAGWFSLRFLGSDALVMPVRLMAASLPLLTVTACLRGYFNAACHVRICGISDTIGFLVRCLMTVCLVWWITPVSAPAICLMTALCTIAGSLASLCYLLAMLRQYPPARGGRTSLTIWRYLRFAVPVMAGSALTSFLSSTNDALVPITLRQAGHSVEEAFSQFGIFEAIIIPTLFFPSTLLCSLSGILVTETARETAACHHDRIRALCARVIRLTLVYAFTVTAVLLLFGMQIGSLLGGGQIAGHMILLLAPVVPFIYLEIVLESIIKGLGAQAFSSLNYLAEYVIRISVVLIFVPLMGFYGIVLSYYASNICGNVSRLVMVAKRTGLWPFSAVRCNAPAPASKNRNIPCRGEVSGA